MSTITLTSLVSKKSWDTSEFSSPSKIIIKKENIGLKDYQHQGYQYNLFNDTVKHDQFYGGLTKVKDRLDRGAPNMQYVMHRDLQRVYTNKIYDRQLSRDLTGPRGLSWQCKNELQRLQTDEREAERDLKRLNRDLKRTSLTSLLDQHPPPGQGKDPSQIDKPRWLLPVENNPPTQKPQNPRLSRVHSFSINTNKINIDRSTPINQKPSSIKRTSSFTTKQPLRLFKKAELKSKENLPYIQVHAHALNQKKQEIEEKLKQFLH